MRTTPSFLLIFFLIFSCTPLVVSQERITRFKSDITVNLDASLLVREEITVYSTGDTIVHGIVREFPTRYRDYAHTWYEVDFEVQEVMHDGAPTPHMLQQVMNGQKIYIGDKNIKIKPGEHTYTIVYTTQRQLGFFTEHDELYWNVTGNGWRLPLEKVEAIIHLPPSIPSASITAEAYTGFEGAKDTQYAVARRDGALVFTTTSVLRPGQGLTIVVTWPKNFIAEPSFYQKMYWFFRDNGFLLWLLFGCLILIIYYFNFWRIVRRMNRPGTIIPLFYPPENMAPSAAGFLKNRTFDTTLLAPDIVDLAVRGFITITYANGTYVLTCSKDISTISQKDVVINKSEIDLLWTLFKSNKKIEINENKNSSTIEEAAADVKKHCHNNYGHYLAGTKRFHFIGGVIFIIVWILLPIFRAPLFGLTMAAVILPEGSAATLWIFGGVFITFFLLGGLGRTRFFKPYTPAGRRLQDALDGFQLFLTTAETERMKSVGTPPTKTPELYEKYLPYAMALGVEKQWTQQFTSMFAQLEREGHPYQPLWYGGRPFSSSAFASQVKSSLNTAISSASMPPGSSSGSGGGGSSGGGGGGGGGGGW